MGGAEPGGPAVTLSPLQGLPRVCSRGLGSGWGAPARVPPTNGKAGLGCGPTWVSAPQVVGTGKVRLFGALLFEMEKMRESCTVFFPSRLLLYTEQKGSEAGGRWGRGPPAPGPRGARCPSEVCTSTAGGRGVPTANLNFVEAREEDFYC